MRRLVLVPEFGFLQMVKSVLRFSHDSLSFAGDEALFT